MEIMEVVGLLLILIVIALIEQPKIAAEARKSKYQVVFYSVLALGFVIGVLDIFKLVPEYNGALIDMYKKLFNQP
jgi:uncharacterized membrane protein YfcA